MTTVETNRASAAPVPKGAEAGVMAAEPCGACGQRTAGDVWSVFDHEYNLDYVARYHECGACGTLSQTPMPGPAQLGAFYPKDYHSFSPTSMLMRARTAMRVSRLGKVMGGTPGAVLDYGCGGGAFLFAAARKFPERRFYGYEIDSENSVTEHMDGRVVIVRGDADELFRRMPPLAVACLNHVIEHLPDPAATVSRIRDSLAPDGVIDGQTPQTNSLERAVFGARWSGFHAPRHTVVFSRDGIRTLFDRCGFSRVEVTTAFNPGGIAVSLGSVLQGARPGRIDRSGFGWLALVGTATALAPIDLLSGRGSMMDFAARR